MSDSDRPRSPFAGLADFSARPPVRVLSSDQIEQMLAAHRLYADSDEVAWAIRDDVARDSEMMSPGCGASLA
jgi:hypothetical protein